MQETPFLQYLIALNSQGYEDGVSGRPSSDRFRSFEEHQHAWQRPSPRLTSVSKLEVNTGGKWRFYRVSHDTIIGCIPHHRTDTQVLCRCIDLIFLSSSVPPERRFISMTLDVEFVDLTFDPSQQLLVVRSPQQSGIPNDQTYVTRFLPYLPISS